MTPDDPDTAINHLIDEWRRHNMPCPLADWLGVPAPTLTAWHRGDLSTADLLATRQVTT